MFNVYKFNREKLQETLDRMEESDINYDILVNILEALLDNSCREGCICRICRPDLWTDMDDARPCGCAKESSHYCAKCMNQCVEH